MRCKVINEAHANKQTNKHTHNNQEHVKRTATVLGGDEETGDTARASLGITRHASLIVGHSAED